MKPSMHSIHRLTRQFEAAGISYAMGGSALLFSLGLTEQVRDWDLTTDVSYKAVAAVLTLLGQAWETAPAGDYPFASSFRLSIAADAEAGTLPIDIIGGFAIHGEAGMCRLPSHASFLWEELQMASPEIWAAAYGLMGRQEKAERLFSTLRRQGGNRQIMKLLLAEPLPPGIRSELERIPTFN